MIKLKNNLLFKNIIILLVSGMITKILGMIGKIIYTRTAGVNVVSLYALITPTLMLIITITQFSFPISISKISAEEKHKNKDILKNAIIIGFIIDFIMIIIVIISAKLIAITLHNEALKNAILAITIIIPFITISSIQRGFLHGKENMAPASITNITEEIIKVILIVLFLPFAIAKSDVTAVIFIILFNVLTEITSIIIMQKAIKKQYLKNECKSVINIKIIKEILNISLPTTLVRLISSIGFFLEPIILTTTLIQTGFSSNYITLQYGIINSYIIPLLSMPTFLSGSIASALLPNITKLYANKKYKSFNKKLLHLLLLSLFVGAICLSIILLFPDELLILIFNVNFGINYIYLIGPFFLILYIQPTLSVAIQAMGKTNKLFITSLTSMVLKYSVLFIFGKLGFGMNALIFSMITGIITTTFLVMIIVLKEINKKI